MTIFQSILLGIVQGITEFLPVSSSGHLVIVPFLLGWKIPAAEAFIFDVLVQLASLVGVFAYFRHDLAAILRAMLAGIKCRLPFADPVARTGWFVLLATVPTGLFGLLLKDLITAAFASPIVSAYSLMGTAILLVIAERVGQRNRRIETLTWKDSLFLGLFQAISVFPGISRSGSTITGGMLRNLERPAAARFSFLMSIPILLAAGLLACLDLFQDYSPQTVSTLMPVFLPGFIASAVVGYLAIRWLIAFLNCKPLYIFSVYCIGMSFIVFLTFYR